MTYPARLSADETQINSIVKAVFADGRLWLLSDSGRLLSIEETSKVRRIESLPPDPILDLCRLNGHAAVLTGYREGSASWTIHSWSPNGWSKVARILAQGNSLIGMECGSGHVSLLTSRRLIDIENGRQKDIAVVGDAILEGIIVLHGTPDDLYVGVNAGEWGGGLARVDRHTGKVLPVDIGSGCRKFPSEYCDPVNTIADVPWKPGCVAVAAGLVHFDSRGRIMEICGDKVERLFLKRLANRSKVEDDELSGSVAFFGLAGSGGALLAAGVDGVYSIGKDGKGHLLSEQKYADFGGVLASFDIPDIILVVTDVNQRRSVSGATPMIVPR